METERWRATPSSTGTPPFSSRRSVASRRKSANRIGVTSTAPKADRIRQESWSQPRRSSPTHSASGGKEDRHGRPCTACARGLSSHRCVFLVFLVFRRDVALGTPGSSGTPLANMNGVWNVVAWRPLRLPKAKAWGSAVTVRFQAARSRQRTSLQGRSLPTAEVGSPVTQLGGQVSGGEIGHPAVAGRP